MKLTEGGPAFSELHVLPIIQCSQVSVPIQACPLLTLHEAFCIRALQYALGVHVPQVIIH